MLRNRACLPQIEECLETRRPSPPTRSRAYKPRCDAQPSGSCSRAARSPSRSTLCSSRSSPPWCGIPSRSASRLGGSARSPPPPGYGPGGAHRPLAGRIRAAALLERSTQELARQHAYLDALIASTPVAIAVLDDQRSVRSVNAAFESLFGYAAAEVVGAGIDGLIVPESLRSESTELETRVRRGETVRVEVERMRKDGRRIQVRLSAAAVKAAADGALVALHEDIRDRKAP